MPFYLQLVLLSVLGAIVGALINWAICAWLYTQHLPYSPFSRLRPELVGEEDSKKLATLHRHGLDFLPIIGWVRLRRESVVWERQHWIRPMLIEIAWAIGLPTFFWWQLSGGLVGSPLVGIAAPAAGAPAFATLAITWFWFHATLIALMFIGTFIDFDEQMIPDQVTVPGTIIALLIAAILPASRLPLTAPTPAGTFAVSHVDFASPATPGAWATGMEGLATCLAIFVIWALALIPKRIPSREFGLGLIGAIRLTLASVIRPARKTKCEIRIKPRVMPGLTKIYLAMLLAGIVLLPASWLVLINAAQKLSLVTAFIGLGVAGGLIWGIRIVGGFVLGMEAMGFGDVTLMCMIGAFLGWQASLAGFVYSIFFAVVFAIVLFIITRESYLAFGPYLCMGALAALLRWPAVWGEFGTFFWMGPWLLLAFGGSLILMAVLLPLVRWLKESLLGVE